MKISIIIPTLNRPDQLFNLIRRLDGVVENEELIVVDDSTSSTESHILDFNNLPIKYIHRANKLGVSSARNIGAQVATGDYLIFFDDDDDFTPNWLSDFRNCLSSNADLIQCDMRIIHGNGKEESVSVKKRKYPVVIPGAWMIKKSLFEDIGGFDERLKFAENTELFIRLDQVEKNTKHLEKENFLYYQSANGGSKNLQNMIDSILIILEKHDSILSDHVKYLYNQVVGVNQLRFRRFMEARKHLGKAYLLKPFQLKTLARLILSYLPILSRQIYKPL